MKNYSFIKSIIPSRRKNKLAVTIVMLFAMVISFFNIHLIAHAATPTINNLTASSNSGEIGDELEFTVEFKLGMKGLFNTKLNIEIPRGLTLLENETSILVDNNPATDDEVKNKETKEQNNSSLYIISFSDFTEERDFKVTCKVKINENAQAAVSNNINCKLQFMDDSHTSPLIEHSFYTFGFDLIMKTLAQEVLPGASFTLHRTDDNNTKYYYTNPSDVNNICEPRFTALQEGTDPTKLTTDENGKISFSGLKPGSYILTQTATAEGYEVLDPLTITIGDDGKLSATGITVEPNNVEDNTNKIWIKNPNDPNNKTEVNTYYGTLMLNNNHEILTYIPVAGGVGVTAFYITGGLLMCGAVVLIINKRKLFGL